MRPLLNIIFFVYGVCYASQHAEQRAKLLENESLLAVGGEIILSDKEATVSNCLMKHKFNEVDYAFDNPEYFNFSNHFFSYKDTIKNSKVYKIVRDMPKGAALHVHDMAILGPDYLIGVTYLPDLYVCFEKDNVQLRFNERLPTSPCNGRWQLMSDARQSSNNVTKFDIELRKHFTLVVEDPDVEYPTIKDTWSTFMKYFITVAPMLSYRPIWEKYFYDALTKFREENIMYVEVRSVLPNLYELDGTVYDQIVTAKAYRKSINRFKKDYPDFLGAKLIFAPSRFVNTYQVDEYLKVAKDIKGIMPEIFAGFDLVGQEDLGNPLIEFEPQLTAASNEINYFFHAGETDWYGTFTDENLVDAILLGAKRIGHAYALPKHPLLLKEIIQRDIGLEVNLISNAVLSLVRDMRNHPLGVFLAQGLPVVLSSDDPGAWEANVISDDFYVAFVGVASRLSDLRLLKKLALNSIRYSALGSQEKIDALIAYNTRWNSFIDNFDCSKY